MQTQTEKPENTTVPYFAFKTLLNTLDTMKDKGIPNRVDRTFLVGMSGAGQTQFISGLKSLGLIDENGDVQSQLKDMVQASPSDRKRLLGEVLRQRYPEAIKLGESNATTGQLQEVFNEEYGVQGDTTRKAIAFYLGAARYTENVPLSPLFQTPKVRAAGGSWKRKRTKRESPDTNGQHPHTSPSPPVADLHPALLGVLSELPKRNDSWTVERRAEFLATFKAVVNFTIPIAEEDDKEESNDFEPGEDKTTAL